MMPTQNGNGTIGSSQANIGRLSALHEALVQNLEGILPSTPGLSTAINQRIASILQGYEEAARRSDGPPDRGLSALVGLGSEARGTMNLVPEPRLPDPFDDNITSERLLGVADLYYVYQHERIGVFRVVQKLKQLFQAGSIRLSSGLGATALYQYDRQ